MLSPLYWFEKNALLLQEKKDVYLNMLLKKNTQSHHFMRKLKMTGRLEEKYLFAGSPTNEKQNWLRFQSLILVFIIILINPFFKQFGFRKSRTTKYDG